MTIAPSKSSSTPVMYGIANCDTIKKARAWLDQRGLAYVFHDYKKVGAPDGKLVRWCRAEGWERVINRAGSTFRNLPPSDKTELDERKACALMVAYPSMIKRPIVELTDGTLLVGFDADVWSRLFR